MVLLCEDVEQVLNTLLLRAIHMRHPGGLGVATPRFWPGGHGGSQGSRLRVSENTVAYFAQKVCQKNVFFI